MREHFIVDLQRASDGEWDYTVRKTVIEEDGGRLDGDMSWHDALAQIKAMHGISKGSVCVVRG